MWFLFSSWFWAIILVIIGIGIIINSIFKVKIPFIRIIIGVILILFGINFILGDYRFFMHW